MYQQPPKQKNNVIPIAAAIAVVVVAVGVILFFKGMLPFSPKASGEDTQTAKVGMETDLPEEVAEDGDEEEYDLVSETEAPQEPAEQNEPSWAGAATADQQNGVLTAGTYLDSPHMAGLMNSSGANWGAYVLDVTNFEAYDIGNAQTPIPASALIGIPILFTVADGIQNGGMTLNDPVVFSYTFQNGRGNMRQEQSGQTVTLGNLLSEALLYSDNNAMNSLMDHLSLQRINDTCHQYGFNSVDMQRKLMTEETSLENYISPRDAAMMVNAIYQDNFAVISRSFLESNFRISAADSSNRGMYTACGGCSTFLNLNGITDSRYNEVGLVVNGDETFIVAAMTVDGDCDRSAPCVSDLASYVLQNLKAN